MTKELIEQLAKEHGMVFDQSYRSIIPKGRVEYVFTSIEHLEAFAKASAQTQGQSEWIPVQSGKLPLNGDMVFGYGYWEGEINGRSKDKSIEYGEWNDGTISINGDAYSVDLVDITHWLPYDLPAAPIESGVKDVE